MTTASSGSLANIRQYAKFNYGVGMMPYDADIKGAPQNAIIGGASLWVMQGKDKETYTGVAKFLDFWQNRKTLLNGIKKLATCRLPPPPTS